jgi:hypothetical protein
LRAGVTAAADPPNCTAADLADFSAVDEVLGLVRSFP